jgi:hypothetical protein
MNYLDKTQNQLAGILLAGNQEKKHQSSNSTENILFKIKNHKKFFYLVSLFVMMLSTTMAQGPLNVVPDPICNTNCCSSQAPCSCSAGVLITGGLPPYSILVLGSSGLVGTTACVGNLCPGAYTFVVRDANNVTVQLQVTVGGPREIAQLAIAFNRMTTQLRSAMEGLEQRVSQRTADLQQALGWIADLYAKDDDIRACGQTIIYAIHESVGHLEIGRAHV